MTTYSLTSDAFTGEVVFSFNDAGLLISYDATGANLSEKQQVFLLRNLPRELAEVKAMLANSPSAKFVQINKEITFEMFWDKYDEKTRSARKLAEALWKRMSVANRNKAYWYIPKYVNSILPGVPKKYAETYLRQELWNN